MGSGQCLARMTNQCRFCQCTVALNSAPEQLWCSDSSSKSRWHACQQINVGHVLQLKGVKEVSTSGHVLKLSLLVFTSLDIRRLCFFPRAIVFVVPKVTPPSLVRWKAFHLWTVFVGVTILFKSLHASWECATAVSLPSPSFIGDLG